MAYCLCYFLHFYTGNTTWEKAGGEPDFGEAWRYSMEISTFKVKVQKAVSEVLGQEYTVETAGSAEE